MPSKSTGEIIIRPAIPDDARAINDIIARVWNQETKSDTYLAGVIKEPDHASHVAEIDGVVCGFVDGFVTLAQENYRRWEVDLLAVLPEYRQRGIARKLVQTNIDVGASFAIDLYRTIIHVDNAASQQAFAHCGFQKQEAVYTLYVSESDDLSDLHVNTTKASDAYFIPVNTFTYSGIWIEGHQTPDALQQARTIIQRLKIDTAGALIPDNDRFSVSATAPGYSIIGEYQFHTRSANA